MRPEVFKMIDRVVSIDPSLEKIHCQGLVPEESSIFEGHFPGHPIMPGVLLIEAQAAINVPSTEKCSPESNAFTRGSASSEARKRVATAPASRRSRFLQNTVGSHTASSMPSPTNQRYSRLYSSSSIRRRSERIE